MKVNDLMALAVSLLEASGNTVGPSQARTCQTYVKNALDLANNNSNFVQTSPCTVPTFAATLALSPDRSRGAGIATQTGSGTQDSQESGVEDGALPSGINFVAPNPFSQTIQIVYTIGSSTNSEVEISVYNVAGRLMRTIATGAQDVGRHQVDWNGTNDAGYRVSPGVYFIHSKIAGVAQNVRVLFLR